MDRQQLIEHLRRALTATANGSPAIPRPQRDFAGHVARTAVAGLRLAAADGAAFYLAVLEPGEVEEHPDSAGQPPRRLELRELIEIVIGAVVAAGAGGDGIDAQELSDKLASWGIRVVPEDAATLLAGLEQTGSIGQAGGGRYTGV